MLATCLGALAIGARAESVLVVATTEPDHARAADGLVPILQGAGHTVTRLTALPADISAYQQVWDLRASMAFSDAEKNQLVAFLQTGRRAFLMGENTGYGATRNPSLVSIISALGGGNLAVVASNSAETINPPWNGEASSVTYPASGTFTSSGRGNFISYKPGLPGQGSAIAFSPGTMTNAPTGTLAVVLDVNFLQPEFGSDPMYPGCGALARALVAYVGGTIVEAFRVANITGPAPGSYKAGAVLEFVAAMSASTTVSGTPRLRIDIGGVPAYADYVSGSGGTALTFRYSVKSGDADSDGISVFSPLDLNGGTLLNSGHDAAVLTFTPPTMAAVRVDTVTPAVPSRPATALNPTKNTRPAITGTAEAGCTVRVYDGSTLVATAVASGDGSWSATPKVSLAQGTHSIKATATDAAGNVSGDSPVLALLIDTAGPTLSSAPSASGTYGSEFSFTVVAADDNGIATYAAAGLPAGLSVNTTTGAITGIPTQCGTFAATVGSTDNAGNASQSALSITIAPRQVAVTGISCVSREYDGSVVVAITGTPQLSGVLSSDSAAVGVSGTALGTVADKHVGIAKPVTVTGLSLSGAAASNYQLGAVTATASITARPLTPGVGVSGKVYDATIAATIVSRNLTPIVGGDAVILSGGVAVFDTSSVGSDKPVTVTGLSLSGASAGDYVLTSTGATSTASVTPRPLTITASPGQTKPYGSSDPSLTSTITAGALAGSDVLSGALTRASGEVVGTYSISQGSLAAGANYTITFVPADFTITAKSVTPSVTIADKVYDGSRSATVTSRSLAGIFGSDEVSLSGGEALFDSKQAGSGKMVTVAGLSLSGSASANYTLAATTATATAGITRKSLTISGVTVPDRAYDGTTGATLSTGAASLVGAAVGDDVSLIVSGATATFASADAGPGKVVTISGLTLAGADASNYTLVQPTATAAITKANATIVLSQPAHVYTGQPKPVTVATTPQGLPIVLTYNAQPTAPTDAGQYAVHAEINHSNYAGSADGTLTIDRASQSVTFAGGTARIGTPILLHATSSSGLPVNFSLLSGNATVAGSTLTLLGAGSVVVRAVQSGSANYAPALTDCTFTMEGKLSQAISFQPPSDCISNAGSFGLLATASSGLPVAFTVVSGPAMVSGAMLTLTGTPGDVVVRASQSGSDVYNPAVDVVASFHVTAAAVNVYFGVVSAGNSGTRAGDIAATLAPNSNQGTLLVVAPGVGVNTVFSFTLRPDGTFTQTFEPSSPAAMAVEGEPTRAASATTLTVNGALRNGRLSGVIEPLGIAFDAAVLPARGASADAAGFYTSPSLAASKGTTYSIVGTNNEMLVLTQTPNLSAGGLATLATNGSFGLQIQTSAGVATISGKLDQPTTTISGSVSIPGGAQADFAGLITGTLRTDRLVNLSSRVRVGGDERVLISGFVIGGTLPKQVLIRGIGPGLSKFGVGGALGNPKIKVFSGDQIVAENDNWSGASNSAGVAAAASRLGAFTLSEGSADAAILTTLNPGAYSVQVFDGGGTGVALAEIYDASGNPDSEYQRLINISARGEAGMGEDVLIGGFIVTGNSPKKLLIRGIGPGLSAFGVGGAVKDPQLKVYRGTTVLAENDNWSAVPATAGEIADAAKSTGAFALTSGSKDAALLVTLAPGSYTAQVAPADGQAGVALVEIYEVP